MRHMRKRIGRLMISLALMLVCGFVQQNASAAELRNIFPNRVYELKVGDTANIGAYTFRVKEIGYSKYLEFRKNTENVYTSTNIRAEQAISDGVRVYYLANNGGLVSINRYTLANGAVKQMKFLDTMGDRFWELSTAYGHRLYLRRASFDEWKEWTYSYNLNSKKLSKVRNDCHIIDRYGKYVVTYRNFRTDISPNVVRLYRISSTNGKFVLIKELGKQARDPVFIDGKLYYASYPIKNSMRKVYFYRCNPNGSGRKRLAAITSKRSNDTIMIIKFGKKSCEYYSLEGSYRYTYATGKKVKIS